jgi:site-specific DNA-cytosine methylase
MIDKIRPLTFVDLFAGCGGLSLGAMKAGFSGVFAVEYQKNAFETLKFNLIEKSSDEFSNSVEDCSFTLQSSISFWRSFIF